MEIKYGLISADSHGNVSPDTWTSRMSARRWGENIPHIVEVDNDVSLAGAQMPPPYKGPVERWLIGGVIAENRAVANAPAVMADEQRRYLHQHWEDVPKRVWDPETRLQALDDDRIDAEVLFPNLPILGVQFDVSGVGESDAAEFELALVEAHNDHFAGWRDFSDRYAPIAMLPYRSPIEVVVGEVKRAADIGMCGVVMLAEPSQTTPGLKHFNDSFWEPLWAVCQDLEMPIHWHADGNLKLNMPYWDGHSRHLRQAIGVAAGISSPAQALVNLMFSGVLERYPRLQFVAAEAGIGWVNYILEGCDHEWERRHLWTEGLRVRPSELFRRQLHVNFWYEKAGIAAREAVGVDNIMWESDYPHSTSTYPNSWEFVNNSLVGVPEEDAVKLRYANAVKLYKL